MARMEQRDYWELTDRGIDALDAQPGSRLDSQLDRLLITLDRAEADYQARLAAESARFDVTGDSDQETWAM